MKEAALVFAAQFSMIFLLGIQSLNVRDRHYIGAAITSFLLGICGFYITSIVGAAKGMTFSVLWWSFVISGPCGIVSAMYLHPRLVQLFQRGSK